jgi:quercetin dioxygenase-like cupin family protein
MSLKGQMEVRFDHETQLYYPGDCIVIPGGLGHRHMAKVLTDMVRVFFIEDI